MRQFKWVPFMVLSLCAEVWAGSPHTEVKAALEYTLSDHAKLDPSVALGAGSKLAETLQAKLKGQLKVGTLDFDVRGPIVKVSVVGELEGDDSGSQGADRIRKAAHEAGSGIAEFKASLSRVSIEMKRTAKRGSGEDDGDAATSTDDVTEDRTEKKPSDDDASRRRIERTIREIKMEREVDREKVRPAPRLDIVPAKDSKDALDTFIALDVPLVRVMDGLSRVLPVAFVLHPETMHRGVWASLKGVNTDEALLAIADSAGLVLERRGKYVTFVQKPRPTEAAPTAGSAPAK